MSTTDKDTINGVLYMMQKECSRYSWGEFLEENECRQEEWDAAAKEIFEKTGYKIDAYFSR